ncbi:hypothetical protein CEUSTIGMA_g3460.t1 [Chlamydomonas eustigma]|uniref:Mitochondrial carrier protein n=1 Tax=Chlamydomonas eustigma TaxID=1157962 RepID=A0A250WYV3_9CHLO|nr:hypothetical protein CEUSTIGMA_g3460.t1 [Chlamydomonas eustigma]|eukprot:GAX76017.1 hypothetical protein CEUSTIGMA_g3460.t1 [Chlamydomonas eustigma]
MPDNEIINRVLAAAVASSVSAVIVTPLDVIKTRMQVLSANSEQASTSGRQLCSGRTIPVRAAGGNVKNLPLADILKHLRYHKSFVNGMTDTKNARGTLSCCCSPSLSSLAYSPEWCLASQHTKVNQLSMLSTFKSIVRKEGVIALWNGLGTAVLLSVPMVGIYMPLYDHMQSRLSKDWGHFAPALSGMVSRAVAVALTAPLELLRTRKQALPASSSSNLSLLQLDSALPSSPTMRGLFSNHTWSRVRGMWTGTGATLARDVPFTMLYWCAVEPLRDHLLSSCSSSATMHLTSPPTNGRDNKSSGAVLCPTEEGPADIVSGCSCSTEVPASHTRAQVLWVNLVAGAASGAVAAAVTTPFDVVKTRLQTRKVVATQLEHLSSHPQGTLGMMRSIWQKEGVKGLFSGMGPRTARTAPACAIVISTYEVLKTVL